MSDWLTLALVVPAVVVPIVFLFGFAGCDVVFGLEYVRREGPILKEEAKTTDSITLSWPPNSNAEKVHFTRVNRTNPGPSVPIALPGTSALLNDTGLDPNTEYEYTARFEFKDEDSKDSKITVTTNAVVVVVRPVFDALGVGPSRTGGTPVSTSWMHTPVSSSVAVVVAARWSHSGTGPNSASCVATYGGVAMTSRGVIGLNGVALNATPGEYQQMFSLDNVPPGASQVTITVTRSAFQPSITVEGCSMSYAQVAAFDPVPEIHGSEPGTALVQTVNSSDNATIVQMFGTDPGPIGDYNKTLRHQGTVKSFVVGDADGGSSVSFTATRPDDADYAGLALRMTPPNP